MFRAAGLKEAASVCFVPQGHDNKIQTRPLSVKNEHYNIYSHIKVISFLEPKTSQTFSSIRNKYNLILINQLIN